MTTYYPWPPQAGTETLQDTLALGNEVDEGTGIDWMDNQGTPVKRADDYFDTDTRRTRFFDGSGVLQATLAVLTTTGALSYDGAVDFQHATTTLSNSNAALTLGDNGGSPTQTFLKSGGGDSLIDWHNIDSTPSAGDWRDRHASDESRRWEYHDGTAWRQVITATNDAVIAFVPDAQSAAAVTWGNGGTPTNVTHTHYVGAAGTVEYNVHNGTSPYQGGWGYDTNADLLILRVANAQQIYVDDGNIRGAADNDIKLGLTGTRFQDVFAYAATFTNTLTLDADSPIVDIGSGGGSPLLRLIKLGSGGVTEIQLLNDDTAAGLGDIVLRNDNGETLGFRRHDGTQFRDMFKLTDQNNARFFGQGTGSGTLVVGADGLAATVDVGTNGATSTLRLRKADGNANRIDFYNTDAAASDGDWRLEQNASENFFLQRHDGTDWRSVLLCSDDTALTLLGGAQGAATITCGPGATHLCFVQPGYDAGGTLGRDSARWLTGFFRTLAVGYLDQDTNVTLTTSETYLEANSATQVITLPDTINVADGHIIMIGIQTDHTSGSIKNAATDTINGNDRSSTGFAATAGLYIFVANGANWEMHGPLARPDTSS